MSTSTVLFIVFLVLKLTGNIAWSWWWVTCPLWIPMGIVVAVMLLGFTVGALAACFGALRAGVDELKHKKRN